MAAEAIGPRSGSELKAVLDAERRGLPFLAFRDGAGGQILRTLDADARLVTIGRSDACEVSLPWDPKVSSTHAVLERLGERWTLTDDGISLNGTYVNGARIGAHRRLVDGDAVRVGSTLITFRHLMAAATAPTRADLAVVSVELTPMQRRVLVALCRPFKDGAPFATPASNVQIASELVLSVEAVKTHMRGLFERFGIGDLPPNEKRARVVELAFGTGTVTPHDL